MNSLAIGDNFLLCLTTMDPSFISTYQGGNTLIAAPDLRDYYKQHFVVDEDLDGQANHHQAPLVSGNRWLERMWSDGHAICYLDSNNDGVFDEGTETLYDPSYAHTPSGPSGGAFNTRKEWEEACLDKLYYAKCVVLKQPILNESSRSIDPTAVGIYNNVLKVPFDQVDNEQEVYIRVW